MFSSCRSREVKGGIVFIREDNGEEERAKECFGKAARVNDDVCLWLLDPAGSIDCPVVFCPEDPSGYFRKDIHGRYDPSGTPYLMREWDPGSRVNVIFGHYVRGGEAFGTLPLFADDPEYRSAHSELIVYDGTTAFRREFKEAVTVVKDSLEELVEGLKSREGRFLVLVSCRDYSGRGDRAVVIFTL